MDDTVEILVNGKPIRVPSGTVVAAAVAQAGIDRFRRSINGHPRGPLCGMGICMECRVTIDGQAQRRSCTTLCVEAMEVRTDD